MSAALDMQKKSPDVFWHIVRNNIAVARMFARLSNAKRTARRLFPDGDYQIVPAAGRAELRQMGIDVNR